MVSVLDPEIHDTLLFVMHAFLFENVSCILSSTINYEMVASNTLIGQREHSFI